MPRPRTSGGGVVSFVKWQTFSPFRKLRLRDILSPATAESNYETSHAANAAMQAPIAEQRLIDNSPLLGAIRDQPGYIKYPGVWYYSLANTVAGGFLKGQDYNTAAYDLGDKGVDDYASDTRKNAFGAAANASANLAPIGGLELEGASAGERALGMAKSDVPVGGLIAPADAVAKIGAGLEKHGGTLMTGEAAEAALAASGKQAMFIARNAGRAELYVGRNATWYELWHELQHFQHWRGIAGSLGNDLKAASRAMNRMSDLTVEQFVYDELRRRFWSRLTPEQLKDASWQLLHAGGTPAP